MTPRNPARLTWAALFLLDASLALAAIGVCMALCLAQVPVMLGKVRMTGVLFGLAVERGAAVERYALSGELSGEPVAPAPAAVARGDGEQRIAYEHRGTSVIARGVLQPGGATFELAFNPAVGTADLGWSVVWLCGLRRAPPGLHSAAPPLATQLAAEQLPFVCRDMPI